MFFLRSALALVGRSIYLGRCARCLEFRCGTVAINCGTATTRPKRFAQPTGRSRWRRQRVALNRWAKGRFDFRASRAVSSPLGVRHVAK
ncbi:unnamed protein product, partial [Prunus brigantina]